MEWYKQIRGYCFVIGHDPAKWDTFKPRLTRQNIEQHCEKAAALGCNAIEPSFAHYRWNFLEHMQEISDFIGNVCDIAHRYRLKVWEHHSVVLVYPRILAGLRYKKWQMDKLTKIDLRDGGIYGSPRDFQSVFCVNNPDFQEAYFDLIETMFLQHPVDLYMPDDMAWGDDYFSCGCPHCRALFKECCGYEMPPNGRTDDTSFYGNMDNPAWRAWLRFRTTRNCFFLQKLKAFLRQKGRGDLPITTCNSDTLQNYTGRIQGTDHQEYNEKGMLDVGSHEIWYGESLTYNSIRNFADQSVNMSIGRRLNIPYFAFTYPRFNEEAVFDSCRNLLVGMGARFCGYLKNDYRAMSLFAKQYSEWFFRPIEYSNVGIVFSRNTRDFYGPDIQSRSGMETHCDEFGGWCEGLIRMNMPFRVLTDSHIEEGRWSGFNVIILPNCACMSEKMVHQLTQFVSLGGTLIATHETSLYSHTGQKEKEFQLAKLFGLSYLQTTHSANYPIVQNRSTDTGGPFKNRCAFTANQYDPALRDALFAGFKRTRISYFAPMTVVLPSNADCQVLAYSPIVMGLLAGYPAITCHPYGKGRVFYVGGLPGLMNDSRSVHFFDLYGEGARRCVSERLPEYQILISNLVSWAVGKNRLAEIEPTCENLLVALKKDDLGTYYLHLLNLPRQEFSPEGIAPEKYFKEPDFDINAGIGEQVPDPNQNPAFWEPSLPYAELPALRIRLHPSIHCSRPTLITIDAASQKELDATITPLGTELTVPAGSFSRYAVIKL